MTNSPCHNCSDRQPNCHSKCERYEEYRLKIKRDKTVMLQESEIIGYTVRSINKTKKRKNKR